MRTLRTDRVAVWAVTAIAHCHTGVAIPGVESWQLLMAACVTGSNA